jgi:hypothetical protein
MKFLKELLESMEMNTVCDSIARVLSSISNDITVRKRHGDEILATRLDDNQ